MIKETKFTDIFVDETGKVFSAKSGVMKELKQYTTCSKRNKSQYLKTSYGLTHRLIADTFMLLEDGMVVNHINGVTTDNRLDNLEVVTQKQNVLHAFETGLTPVGEGHSRAKFKDSYLKEALDLIACGCSVRSVAKQFGISQSYLNKIKNNEYRKTLCS